MRMLLLTSLLSFGCKPAAKPEPIASNPITFATAAERMLAMSDGGWIVSRGTSGEIQHQGDSLIWTSLAMGALDCVSAMGPESSLLAMIDVTGGRLWRHPSLPGEWSLDGAIGFYAGVLEHVARCPGTKADWARAVRFHAESKPELPPRFQTLLDVTQALLGNGPMPSDTDRGLLAAECVGWAVAAVSQHSAGFRLHLCYLTLKSMDAPKGREAFCSAVEAAKMPLLEQFCGRPGLSSWVDGFGYNIYEYKHQRADWEDPDGNGIETPGLDYLVALRALGE